MPTNRQWARRKWFLGGASILVILALVLGFYGPLHSQAGSFRDAVRKVCGSGPCCDGVAGGEGEMGGTWYWLRSPEEEKRVTMGLYNRYCIRCHGVDGRGVWDIPGIPNFTNPVWQASRSDADLARIIVEGRGAVMPPFRGALSLEEAWAIGRYLRSFVPGNEVSRPDYKETKEGKGKGPAKEPLRRAAKENIP